MESEEDQLFIYTKVIIISLFYRRGSYSFLNTQLINKNIHQWPDFAVDLAHHTQEVFHFTVKIIKNFIPYDVIWAPGWVK